FDQLLRLDAAEQRRHRGTRHLESLCDARLDDLDLVLVELVDGFAVLLEGGVVLRRLVRSHGRQSMRPVLGLPRVVEGLPGCGYGALACDLGCELPESCLPSPWCSVPAVTTTPPPTTRPPPAPRRPRPPPRRRTPPPPPTRWPTTRVPTRHPSPTRPPTRSEERRVGKER